MVAKLLLPALGGSSAVWLTCLSFFQVVLLVGYLYAHWLGRLPSARLAVSLHLALLALAAGVLLFGPQPDLNHAAGHPLAAIFTALTRTIGLPFLLLSSSTPLLQLWLAREERGAVTWRLFALSNAGSMLALALYPSVIELHLPLSLQRSVWAWGFVIYAVLAAAIAWRAASVSDPTVVEPTAETAQPCTLRAKLLWFLLPAGAAMQLSAVTGHLSQNIAAIPLLWILPLAAYLLTFIVAFETPRLYRRFIVVRLLVVMLASLGYMLSKIDSSQPILISISFFLLELFCACLFCHGEVYALRPARPSETTLFYLLLAAGGAAGTLFIAVFCPLLFDANYDVALAFLVTAALALVVTWPSGWPQRALWLTGTGLLLTMVIMLHVVYARRALLEERNFYGSLRVKQTNWPPQADTVRTLLHGNIEHGTQWFAEQSRRVPTTYYAMDSGIGLALQQCCDGRPRRIGVVGLGTGTLAAYGRAGDQIRFYEINPAVPPIARNLFTYIRESPAQVSFAEGDARLTLANDPPQHFDVLAIDAFSGDAIPVHLLTLEAMQIYSKQLAPNGILAFHVSNQFLDLAPEVAELAAATGMQARIFDTPSKDAVGEYRATWVLLTNNASFFARPQISAVAETISRKPNLRAWTDDRSSLLPILQWLPDK